jgi:antitoxin (DNA-binding transcriptional repressor) of toxin-antitoxin stability system
MAVSMSEFKKNLKKYVVLSQYQTIELTNHGKVVAKLTGTSNERVALAKSLFGILPDEDIDLNKIRDERLSKI